jgi:hypothetical protein
VATIIDAILTINPSARVSLADEDVNQITWLEGTSSISNEDILAKQSELVITDATAKAQKISDKASGNQKLLDLGLSQDEVDALMEKR